MTSRGLRLRRFVQCPTPNRSGQAMTELAIFGTFMLFGLALVVRYGMQQYFDGTTTQEAFRQALKEAYDTRAYDGQPSHRPPAGSERPEASPSNQSQVLFVKDVYMPDPTNPFLTGNHASAVSSGSVQWGTDSAELSPENDNELSHTVFQVNDKRISTLPARFQPDLVFLYDANTPTLLCRYERAYGSVVVKLQDALGNNIDADIGLQFCDLGGGAIIQLKDKSKTPVRVVVKIIDSCGGDFIDPSSCKDQCTRIQNEGLVAPAYCSQPPISPFNKFAVQGLDLLNSTRTHTTSNALHLTEGTVGTQSDTTVNETTVVKRDIKTTSTPIDATTSPTRTRQYHWNTKW